MYCYVGRRISKTVDGTTTWFIWDGESRLIAEYVENSSATTAEITHYYSYVPSELAPSQVTDANGSYVVVSDHLSTPKLLVDIDSENIVWRATKEAFGDAAVNEDVDGNGIDVTFNFRFPGQYADAESGLYYNYHRYYDPEIGRYITSDPIGLNGGINTYGYVGGNPLMYIDPYGLFYGECNFGEALLGLCKEYSDDMAGYIEWFSDVINTKKEELCGSGFCRRLRESCSKMIVYSGNVLSPSAKPCYDFETICKANVVNKCTETLSCGADQSDGFKEA